MPLFELDKYNFKVMYGGRGGLKTWGAARALIILASQKQYRILCAREFQGSIRDSVHAVLKDQIELMGMSDDWIIGNDKILNTRNGSYFIFEGLKNNAKTVKGKEKINFCWCEEAESISWESWEYLIPTIKRVPGAEIWVTFNPSDEMDATHQMFITNPRKGQWTNYSTYLDNPWLPQGFLDDVEQMKEENYKKYLHYYMGEPNTNFEEAIIQPEWVNAALDAHITLDWEVLGAHITSFDPADTGDFKAMATRHSSVVTHLEEWSSGEIQDAIPRAYKQAFDTRSLQLVVDADGLGASMKIGLDKWEKEFNTKYIPFHGGGKVRDPKDAYPPNDPNKPIDPNYLTNEEVFRNLRSQKYYSLADRFENTYLAVKHGKYIDPEKCISISSKIDKKLFMKLRQELTGIRRKKGESGNRRTLMSKKDMRSIGVKSPNMADALMMLWANEEVFGTVNIKIKSQWSR